MASTVAQLMVKIGGDISGLEKSLSRAQRKMRDTGKQMQRVGKTMTTRITAPLAAVGGIALKTAADFESLQQSMNTLNGSVEEGTRNFERLKEFSATTPFQLRDLAEAQNMLQGFGQSADDAFESVSMIGDIAAVASGDIKGIGIAFGQAAAEGRLMTRDIRQLINQGVPAIKLLADTMDVAQSEVLDLASNGEISFEILQQAFQDATTEGGMFANGMEKQAQTLAGRFSTMKDNINLALGSIGDTMSGLVKNMMDQVIDITQAFRDLDASTKQMITTAGLLAAAIGPAIFILGKLLTVLGALLSPVGLVIAAIGGLIVIGKNLYDNWETIAAELTHLWEGIELAAWTIVGGITGAFESMSSGILNTLSSMAQVVEPTLAAPFELAKLRIQSANESIQDHIAESRKEFEKAGEAAVASRDDMTSLSESFWSITDAVQSGLKNSLNWLSDKLFELGERTEFDMNIGQADISSPLEGFMGPLERAREVGGGDSFAEALFGDIGGFADNLLSMGETYDEVLDGMMAKGAEFSDVTEAATSNIGGFWDNFTDNFKSVGQEFSQFISEQMTQAITSFSETVGTMFSGADDGMRTAFEKVITIVLDFAKRLGQILIAIGSAMAFTGILSGPGGAYIAAGSALVALSTGLSKGIEKRARNREQRTGEDAPELASGGLAFGPTMAMVGDNPNARTDPEVISPLSKLKDMVGGGTQRVEVEGQIRGDTIHLANARGANKFR